MVMPPMLWWVLAALACRMLPLAGSSRGITISENGYRGVVVAIAEGVQESQTLLTRIKQVFIETSSELHRATRGYAYFSEISILLPPDWNNTQAEQVKHESLQHRAVLIDDTPTAPGRWPHANTPYVRRTQGCGRPGDYIHITSQFLLHGASVSKLMTSLWARYRYGVYDEGAVGRTPSLHARQSGDWSGTRCSSALPGKIHDLSIGQDVQRCLGSDGNGLPVPACVWRPDHAIGQAGMASLLYNATLPQITEFCDDQTERDNKTLHDKVAPTHQNRLCDRKSIWQVLREHEDIKGRQPDPSKFLFPSFHIVRTPTPRRVLVLDSSQAMNNHGLLQRVTKAWRHFVLELVPDGERLAVVTFSDVVNRTLALTTVSNTTRTQIADVLPLNGSGLGSSIEEGLSEGLSALKEDGGTAAGEMVLFTLGNKESINSTLIEQVSEANVTVHLVSLRSEEEQQLESLARVSGGQTFWDPGDHRRDTTFFDAFITLANINAGARRQHIQISSSTHREGEEKAVFVGESLTRNIVWLFDYEGSPPGINITSPLGIVYNETHKGIKHYEPYKYYTLTIPGPFQQGKWLYRLINRGQKPGVVRTVVTAQANSTRDALLPIKADVSLGRRYLNFSRGHPKDNIQSIFVTIHQGGSPVLGARVEAVIDRPGANRTQIQLELRDHGGGADALPDDGLYSAFFINFTENGLYSVKVYVQHERDATGEKIVSIVSSESVLGKGKVQLVMPIDEDPSDTGEFERVQACGTFRVADYRKVKYSPAQIRDLSVSKILLDDRMVGLQWTSPGGEADQGKVARYDLRYHSEFAPFLSNFDAGIAAQVDLEEYDLEPKSAGLVHNVYVRIPRLEEGVADDRGYMFALRAYGPQNLSSISNYVTVTLRRHQAYQVHWSSLVVPLLLSLFLIGVALTVLLATRGAAHEINVRRLRKRRSFSQIDEEAFRSRFSLPEMDTKTYNLQL